MANQWYTGRYVDSDLNPIISLKLNCCEKYFIVHELLIDCLFLVFGNINSSLFLLQRNVFLPKCSCGKAEVKGKSTRCKVWWGKKEKETKASQSHRRRCTNWKERSCRRFVHKCHVFLFSWPISVVSLLFNSMNWTKT